jgi:hypothetical protein
MIYVIVIVIVLLILGSMLHNFKSKLNKNCLGSHEWTDYVHWSKEGIKRTQFCQICGKFAGSDDRLTKEFLEFYRKEKEKESYFRIYVETKIRELAILHSIDFEVAKNIYECGMKYRLMGTLSKAKE